MKTGNNAFSLLDASNTLIAGSINTNLIADKAVTTLKLQDKSVTEPKLADLAVSTRTINNGAVTEQKLASNSVTSSKIAYNTINNNHIINNTITGSKIAEQTLTGNHIANNSLNNAQYNSDSVNDRVIASGAIKERHYSNLSIPNRAYKEQSIYGNVIKNGGITSIHMGQNSITTNAIANGAVTEPKLADGAVTSRVLNKGAVEQVHLTQNAVTNIAINDGAVSTSKYAPQSITKDKLAKDVMDLIGDPVQYDENNNVTLRKDLTVTGNIKANGTITGLKVLNSVFMDLAEAYEPSENEVFNPGDIVQVNEDGKLIRAISSSHFPIVGVVSDEYAACYGATEDELQEHTKIPVGLIGKIHVNVIGSVKLGDKIALIKDGIGASCTTNNLLKDNIIGKALETNTDNGMKKVLCLVFPN